MTGAEPAFYAHTGSRRGDVLAILHVPYTLWHLSYVVIGSSLADEVDVARLVGTLAAFALGLGVGAHALDEFHGRPLGTGLAASTLLVLGWGGLVAGGAVAILAAFVVSPFALVWGAAGVFLAAGYALEWNRWVHTKVGFALAWGAFPVVVGYWAQMETITGSAAVVAAAAAVLSFVQRILSTPARHVRRRVSTASAKIGDATWDRRELLASWERPLKLLAAAHVLLALGLLLRHL